MARNMVTKYGMSETLGPMYHERAEMENLSPATREAIEAEIKGLVKAGELNARRILTERKADLHRLAQGLLAHETVSREEIGELIAGREIRREAKAESKENSKQKGVGAAVAKGASALPATAMCEE